MPPRAQLRVVLLGLVALLLARAPVHAEPITHVYHVQHREAAELLPLVETALAGEGTARADPSTQELVLVGEPRAIAVALELLAVQDRARRTVVVEAWSERHAELLAAGYRVDWTPGAEAPRVGRLRPLAAPPAARREDGVLGSGGADPGGGPPRPEQPEFSARLPLAEGSLGRIASGRVVPFVTRGEGGATTSIIESRSGLLARPHVLGADHVELDLAPYDGSTAEDDATRFDADSRRLVVEPGELVVVGGVQRAVSRAPGSASARAPLDEAVLLLRVELE